MFFNVLLPLVKQQAYFNFIKLSLIKILIERMLMLIAGAATYDFVFQSKIYCGLNIFHNPAVVAEWIRACVKLKLQFNLRLGHM